jgi:hypothetical protein
LSDTEEKTAGTPDEIPPIDPDENTRFCSGRKQAGPFPEEMTGLFDHCDPTI